MGNLFILLLIVVLLPLHSVASARAAIGQDAGPVIAAAHAHAHDHANAFDHANHDATEHDASGGHSDSTGQFHAHGASIVSETRVDVAEGSACIAFNYFSREIPFPLTERIERPQWSPAD